MRLVIIILLLAVVLWLTGALLGFSQQDATLPDPRDSHVLNRIGDLFPKPRALAVTEIVPVSCLNYPDVILQGAQACVLKINQATDGETRRIQLQLSSGALRLLLVDGRMPDKKVEGKLPDSGADGEITEFEARFSKEAGELTLRCAPGLQRCSLRLKEP